MILNPYLATGVAVSFAAVIVWALVERNMRLADAVQLEREKATVTACGLKLSEQNGRVRDLKELAAARAQEAAEAARKAVEREKAHEAERKRLQALIGKPPPTKPDGKPAGCDEAWATIEEGK